MPEHEPFDMDEVYRHVAGLSAICRTPFDEPEHGPWLIGFHGMDAMRCGVIYGMAKAIRQERWKAGVERMRYEHPEAYR